jgi:hypothetical protein
MSTSALGDMARVLGLDACGSVLDSFGKLPAAAALDAALSQAPATDAQTAMAQMVRRGLDSSLVALVRAAVSGDVVARGLLAWDVLNGAVVERGEYRDQLHADARAVAAVLPPPGHGFTKIDARRGAPLPGGGGGPRIAQLMRALGGPDGDPADASPAALDRARNFARILHRSHLSTMASFYLADLVFQHRFRRALPDLVEVLLDRGAEGVEELVVSVGEIEPGVEPTITELGTYAHVRTLINKGRAGEALTFAETNRLTFSAGKLSAEKAAAINPRPTLAYTEAALRKGAATIDGAHIEALTRLEQPWRYAFHVATLHAATKTTDLEFLSTLGTYLQSFGNDYETWYQVATAMPKGAKWGVGFLALLVRELEQLPHEPQAWRAAAMILGKGDAAKRAAAECDERLRQQAALG